MPRNLDLTALRSFVAVADTGGVTRAAGFLNLTQSAVSMQLKRLEESMGQALLDRSARTVSLTTAGEQLVSYGRRLLALNDEVVTRMTGQEFEGEIRIGVPHDIVFPVLPNVLKQFTAAYPRIKINLVSSFTARLKEQFAGGEIDAILTTETGLGEGGETLRTLPLVWVGAPGGTACRERPLRLAFEHRCIFRETVQRHLDEVGIPWTMAVEADSFRAIAAMVTADLAVHTMLEGAAMHRYEFIPPSAGLPALPVFNINLYTRARSHPKVAQDLADMVRAGYAAL